MVFLLSTLCLGSVSLSISPIKPTEALVIGELVKVLSLSDEPSSEDGCTITVQMSSCLLSILHFLIACSGPFLLFGGSRQSWFLGVLV